jgi:hypothetical protein
VHIWCNEASNKALHRIAARLRFYLKPKLTAGRLAVSVCVSLLVVVTFNRSQ